MNLKSPSHYRIDGLQYANWSEQIFQQMRAGGVDAIHVTIAYHEDFQEMVQNIIRWNRWFEEFPDLIFQGFTADDVTKARETHRTAIFFGFQTPAPIEADIGLVEIVHRLGARFMQLTYNNQSLLATGCYETEDPGITRMGREVIIEMNRVGLVVDMSHSAQRSTLEAIEISTRPIVITHANPSFWAPARRNKSNEVIQALVAKGGMIGFSLYPHHIKNKSDCTLESFCLMVKQMRDWVGIDCLGIGTDLCQNQPDHIVDWMRAGRWTKGKDYGEGSAENPGFPPMPSFFQDNRHFTNIEKGLAQQGLTAEEIGKFMGDNWFNFFKNNFTRQ